MKRTVIMPEHAGIFECEQHGETMIICPNRDLTEVVCQKLRASDSDIVGSYKDSQAKHVIVDFHKTTAFGSTALELFVRLWKSIRARGGRLAFCNLSEQQREILQLTRLDQLWDIFNSRHEANLAVGNPG